MKYKWYEIPYFGNFAGFIMVITATPLWVFAVIADSMNWAWFASMGSAVGFSLWLNYGKQENKEVK